MSIDFINPTSPLFSSVANIGSVFGLGKTLYDFYKDKNHKMAVLFCKAFEETLIKVSSNHSDERIKNFLKICKSSNEIENVYKCETLLDFLCQINDTKALGFRDEILGKLFDEINKQFVDVILKEGYEKIFNLWFYQQFNSQINKLNMHINEIVNLHLADKELKTDNRQYAHSFNEALCMHRMKKGHTITLSDIFVMPDAKINNKTLNVLDTIRNFINNNSMHLFILEGFGGYGKSSIAAYLAYNYMFCNSHPNIEFLNKRQLITVRLREIDANNIYNSICKKLNNIEEITQDAVIIFEGLDELCLLENRNDGHRILETLVSAFLKSNRKIIVTSRPTYIRYDLLRVPQNIKYEVAYLQAFDNEKTKKLVNLFEKIDNNYPEAINYVRNILANRHQDNDIYSSPFVLYLIMSGDIKEDEKNNSWKLMHRIFHEELFNPLYTQNTRNLSQDDIENIYQYNCNIAYEMYKTQNVKSSFTYKELKIIQPNSDIADYIKKSHGLFSYMRNNDGAIEFVHNHVRDFFLCEKILREISEWYDTNLDSKSITLNLSKMLHYYSLNEQTKFFIREAFLLHYDNIKENCTNEHLSSIFDLFHNSGGYFIYNYFEEINTSSINAKSSLSLLSNVLGNASYIYKVIYLINRKDKYINWFSVKITNTNVLTLMSENLEYADLSGQNLEGVDFRNANLKGANLANSNLTNSILYNANLENTNLECAIIKNSNFFKAVLFKAKLKDANLSGSNLREAILSNADLSGANFTLTCLHGADLSKSNLNDTIFYMSILDCAIFNDTNLEKTINLDYAYFKKIAYNKSTQFPLEFNISTLNLNKKDNDI